MHLLVQTAQVVGDSTHGFVAVYTAGRIALEEGKHHQLYDHDAFRAHVHRFEPEIADINLNPPTFAVLMTPWAHLPYSTARTVWIWLSFGALIVSLLLVYRELQMGVLAGAIWFSLGLSSATVLECFRLGQVYTVALLLWVIAWVSLRRSQSIVASISLGTLFCWKLLGPWMLLILIRTRRYRAALSMFVVVGLLVVASISWLGAGSWLDLLAVLTASSNGPSSGVTAYQTVTSFFHHLFSYHPGWNPDPVWDAPFVATWGGRLASLAVIAFWALGFVRCDWRNTQWLERMLAVGLLVSLAIKPLTLDYHFPLTLLSIAVLADQFFSGFELTAGSVGRADQPTLWATATRAGLGRLALFVAAITLIHADLPYRSPRLAEGAWALLAYPKLLGALILIGMSRPLRGKKD